MATNYTQFSFIVDLTQEEAKQTLEDFENPEIMKTIFDDPDNVNISVDLEKRGLWFYSEEDNSVEDTIAAVRYLINKYQLPPIGFEWANSCSRPILGEFGGGAVWTDGKECKYCLTGNWLSEQFSPLSSSMTPDDNLC